MNTQAISNLESQVGQLTIHVSESERGKFSSQSIPNPKGEYALNKASSSIQG